jgi:hypothetical protein
MPIVTFLLLCWVLFLCVVMPTFDVLTVVALSITVLSIAVLSVFIMSFNMLRMVMLGLMAPFITISVC